MAQDRKAIPLAVLTGLALVAFLWASGLFQSIAYTLFPPHVPVLVADAARIDRDGCLNLENARELTPPEAQEAIRRQYVSLRNKFVLYCGKDLSLVVSAMHLRSQMQRSTPIVASNQGKAEHPLWPKSYPLPDASGDTWASCTFRPTESLAESLSTR